MKKENINLGFCPIGKFVFSHEDALHYKKLLEEKLKQWNIHYTSIDGVLKDGIVRDVSDVPKVVSHLKEKKVHAVFMPHCNFGTENAVGLIGRDLGVPVLVWAPRDEAPLADGTRLRDSLCGLFASTKVLRKLAVPFTYIENCRIDDTPLEQGVDTFLRAVNISDALRNGLRIGHIGQRIDFFWTTIVNESELLERYKVQVQPIDMVEFIEQISGLVSKKRNDYEKALKEIKERFDTAGFNDESPLIHMFAFRDRMFELRDQFQLDGIAFQSFMSIINELGGYTGLGCGMVSDEIPVAMESDIHGAISTILLKRASLDTDVPYLADVTVRHPDNENGVLLWHSDAPLSLMHPDVEPAIGHHWILPSPLSGMTHFRLKDGPITIARFDGDTGDYMLATGEGKAISGPYTLNNYVWMEVDNWPYWERTLMEGPFIHHTGMIYGHYSKALVEACKYVPELSPIPLNTQ